MSKLCLSVDSSSYTTLYLDVFEDADEAIKTLLSREANDGEGLSVAVSEDGCKTRITFSDGDPEDEYFVVAELMPLPKEHFVAWWHGFDGVGFDLKGSSNDREDAIDMLNTYVENYWKGRYDLEDYEKGDLFCGVENGADWEGIEVYSLSEIVRHKEVA